MKITMLGTGNAMVTECYNTCYVIEDEGQYMMVDAGGGNTVLHQLKAAGLRWQDMHHIFVTHKHIDHILGVVWMIRIIAQNMSRGKYEGEAFIYGHDEVIRLLRMMSEGLLQPAQIKWIDKRIHLIELQDGKELEIAGHRVLPFDIHSTKAKQYGYCYYYGDGKKLCCCGDEPFNSSESDYVRGSDWLLHESYCLFSDADVMKPYEKHHSTVKDACMLAETMGVANLLLYHTEDTRIKERKALYTAEGAQHFSGRLFIPDDLETVE